MVGMMKLGKKDTPKVLLLAHQYSHKGDHKVLHFIDADGTSRICVPPARYREAILGYKRH